MRYEYNTDGVITQTVGQDDLTITGGYFTTGDFTFPDGFESNPFDYKYENGALTLDQQVILVGVDELRVVRDELLRSSDFTQLSDSPHTTTEKASWATYRQDLRDLPSGYTPVADPTYPTKP